MRLSMMRLAMTATLLAGLAAPPALAGNTSSNSSSNSSNGIHTRVDTVITDDDHGRRRYYERRIYRDERAPRERRRSRGW